MKSHKISTGSRRRTPWDLLGSDDNLTASEHFVKQTYLNTYSFRHPAIQETEEIKFLNSCILKQCRHCGSEHLQKWGKTSYGINRYRCCDCGHTSTIITNTIFDQRKISITEWVDFLIRIFGHESFKMSSYEGRNSGTTIKYWIAKLFKVLEGNQDGTDLHGKVWIDETYIPLHWADREFKENGLQYRGISRNQICIAVGMDST